MPPFPEWLSRVLASGESVQEDPPALAPAERPRVVELLRDAFESHALDIAGPPIAFDPDVALAAAVALSGACWRLVGDAPTPVRFDAKPVSPSAHLSADVTLRFLTAVYRRARLRDPESEHTRELETLLRAWPLSGVLADLEQPPTTPTDFHGHTGLQLLFAERLFTTGRPSWVPESGEAREWAERVYLERGKPLPAPPPKEEPRA
jgi:hypothetical protein